MRTLHQQFDDGTRTRSQWTPCQSYFWLCLVSIICLTNKMSLFYFYFFYQCLTVFRIAFSYPLAIIISIVSGLWDYENGVFIGFQLNRWFLFTYLYLENVSILMEYNLITFMIWRFISSLHWTLRAHFLTLSALKWMQKAKLMWHSSNPNWGASINYLTWLTKAHFMN